MRTFYLGIHRGRWLETLDVPVFPSVRTLAKYRDNADSHPRAFVPWALDSGAYTELVLHGEWESPPDTFGGTVYRILDNVGTPPDFCSPQDWPCDPGSLRATGLTSYDHQMLTIESLIHLREEFPATPWIPVLQGYRRGEHLQHVHMYAAAGIDLTNEALVGLGGICRRGDTAEIGAIIAVLHSMGLRLHGYGVKRLVLDRHGPQLVSADSMSWSATARHNNIRLPGCLHTGPCNNCARYALRWRVDHLRFAAQPHQLMLNMSLAS